ncbi:MarR family winged helix-turn-helix transcriptional regulator [Rhizobium sp. Rhizsp82]|uniref:MarR family winged helix-turn-helix transcriptional regulator n=1 Tax=Rhizobium sp. Rhizsp82 TaxID=3243057 RepID=UPI0039B54FB0
MKIPFGPDNCYCFAARRSSRWLTRTYDAALAPCDITISQFSILTVLEHHEHLKIADMSRIMVMERTSLVRALKPLLESSLIQSVASQGERARVISLTSAGRAKLVEATPFWEAAQAAYESKFGESMAKRGRADSLQISEASLT